MRLMMMTAPALAAALLSLAACDTKPVDPTANDADLVDAPACNAADLTLAFVDKTEDANERTYTYAYVNSGKKPCTVRGYPTAQFTNNRGTSVVPISTKHADVTPRRDPIRPGKRVLFDVISAKTGSVCVTNAHIFVSAPADHAKEVKGTEDMALCDDIKLTPVRREGPSNKVVVVQ